MKSVVLTFVACIFAASTTANDVAATAQAVFVQAIGPNVSQIRVKDAMSTKSHKTLSADVERVCDCGPVRVEFSAPSDCDAILAVKSSDGHSRVELKSGYVVHLRKSSDGVVTVDYDD